MYQHRYPVRGARIQQDVGSRDLNQRFVSNLETIYG
jgi:hypothetical protein